MQTTLARERIRPKAKARAPATATTPSYTPILLPPPRPWGFWRNPRRFLRARLRLMFGAPLSRRWSLDRGLPAHRYFVRLFLEEFRDDIAGRCLEFDGRDYLDHFGGKAVTRHDVLHLEEGNPRATIVADIAAPNSIPADSFDCIVCTHVLHMIPDVDAAIREMHRILKPGGVLLTAVPQASWCDEREGELWRFTRLGLHRLISRRFGDDAVATRAYGNSLVAAGEMRGLIADEFTWKELHTHDVNCAVEVCSRAVKAE